MPDLEQLRQSLAAAVAERDRRTRGASASAVFQANDTIRARLEELLGREVALEADVPLVLLPVRVEVRSTADLGSLRVRIYHDALHAEGLEEGVSASERAAGIAYWKAAWNLADAAAPWPALLAAVGVRRAAWVAEALRPVNPAARPVAPPEFPATDEPMLRAAVARTLPDRFFVRIEQDGAAPVTGHGSAIPDELPVGLLARGEIAPLPVDGDQDLPPLDASLRWLVDFGEAERVGMALTVALPRPGQPVRRLLVYGVRSALDPAAGAARLARLLRSHRYTDGAQFLAQGTPTNNTDGARADWSRRAPAGPPSLDPAPAPDPGSNAAVSAHALGLDASTLAGLDGAGDRQQARACAFNTALWTTTWGEAIEHLTPAGRADGDKRLDSPAIDEVREHWVDHVRGRGPLPALRLGRQPYGLLPLVATGGAWKPLRGGFVEDRLVPFIDQKVRLWWNKAAANARNVQSGPIDETLPPILGTDAVLQGLRVRTALSPEPFLGTATALTLPDLGSAASGQDVTRALLLLSGVSEDAIGEGDVLGTKTRTLALPLVHESDPEFLKALLQPVPQYLPHRSVLQVLLAHAFEADRHARDSVVDADLRGRLREAIAANTVGIDAAVVGRAFDTLVGHGAENAPGRIDSVVNDAARQITAVVGSLDRRTLADRHPIPAFAPPTVVGQVAAAMPQRDGLRGAAGMQVVGELFRRSAWSSRVRAALQEIADVDALQERRLLLCETLDCCSHRLDAWLTAAASRRLSDVRELRGGGACIGAYGWLEDIALVAPADAGQVDGRAVLKAPGDGGYIHAPGMTHAVTAGILRSARLSHRRGDPNADAMDIDLSSARMRDAATVLDGMRRGQSLGALLGYRLERRLHETSGAGMELDRFIYVLRTLAPLRGGKLTEPGQPVQESIAASDVVDGLRLMAVPPAAVRQKLVDGPDDTRYITPPDVWQAPRPGEAEAVLGAIAELEQTHDAVADLLLAESVFQLACGNPARAAAALDVLGAGEAVPPEPEVLRTPRSGLPIQHRLAIVVPEANGPWLPGWNGDAPRARAEPRLERWAQAALGAATAIAVTGDAGRTLAEANLSALDLLYDADGDSVQASSLAARLRAALEGFGDADLPAIAPLWELASMLRAVMVGARPLGVADVGRPVNEGDVGRTPDADEIAARATESVDALHTATVAGFTALEFAQFGLRGAPGQPMLPDSALERERTAEALAAMAQQRLVKARELLVHIESAATAGARVELASQVLATVFGGQFVSVPRLMPAPPGEQDLWNDAVGPGGVGAGAGAQIRPWLQRAGSLRKPTADYAETLLVREALGRAPRLRVVQSPASAFGRWVALPFVGDPPTVPLASMVVEVVGDAAGGPEPPLSGALAGLVLDQWTEVVPRRLKKTDPAQPDAAPTFSDIASTAVAINANGPSARAPQAVLLALSADGQDWDDQRLVAVLDEALALARMRTLTLQDIPFVGRMLPALYFRDWSLQGEPVIDWSKVATMFNVGETLTHLSIGD